MMAVEVFEDQTEQGKTVKNKKAARKKSNSSAQYSCEVTCLDGSKLNFVVNKLEKGEAVYGKVVEVLSITEKEYIGLLYKNEKGSEIWLDIHKEIKHQLGDVKPNFELRIKFYEPEPTRLQDEFMRYLLYMQIREDLVKGRLVCNENTYALLGSYTAQAELGDFNLSEHDHNYLDDYEFSPNHSTALVNKIHDLHKKHRGQTPAQAELNFLEIAKKIHLYGIEIHKAQDVNGPVNIGVSALGISIYRKEERESIYRWQLVDAVSYNRRKFTVKMKESVVQGEGVKKKQTLVYYFDSARRCKQCFKTCVEYHTFFRLTCPDKPRKKSDKLKLGSSFRYSDRTLYQLHHKRNDSAYSDVKPIKRTPSKRRSLQTVKVSSSCTIYESPIEDGNKEGRLEPANVVSEKVDIVVEEADAESTTPTINNSSQNVVQYEEIEIDESNPDDENFDQKEWEMIEKSLPDGTKKRYRRRVILTTITTVTKTSYMVHHDCTEEEVYMESKPIASLTAEKNLIEINGVKGDDVPDGPERKEEMVSTVVDKTAVQGEESNVDFRIDGLLLEISNMSRSLDDLDDQGVNSDDADKYKQSGGLNSSIICDNHKSTKNDDDLNDRDDTDEGEKENAERLEERKKKEEEEKILGENLNATITSIFTLPEDDVIRQPVGRYYNEKDFELNLNFESAKETSSLTSAAESTENSTTESSDEVNDLTFERVEVAGAEYVGFEIESHVRTASLLKQKKENANKPRKVSGPKTLPKKRNSYAGEGSSMKNSAGCRTSAYNERTSSRTGFEQEDFHQPHNDGPNSQIIYTLTDVANVEQGGTGFVSAVKAKHEVIANEEEIALKRSSRIFVDDSSVPKGHVVTRNVSFDEDDTAKLIRTREPPAVPAKPTIIIPAHSELPDEEIIFTMKCTPEEMHTDVECDVIESTNVPSVETQAIVFKETDEIDDITLAPMDSESNVIKTQAIQIIPQTEQKTYSNETSQVVPLETITYRQDSRCTVTTQELPTEVITETVTIEGDSSVLTPDELQRLLNQTDESREITAYTTTQVIKTTTLQKVITGQTITVTGERSEEEMKQDISSDGGYTNEIIEDAVNNSANYNSDHNDGTLVVTAVQTYDDHDDIDSGDTEI